MTILLRSIYMNIDPTGRLHSQSGRNTSSTDPLDQSAGRTLDQSAARTLDKPGLVAHSALTVMNSRSSSDVFYDCDQYTSQVN